MPTDGQDLAGQNTQPLPALPAAGAPPERWRQYFEEATAAIHHENEQQPGWLGYMALVRSMLAGDRWATSPWRAWRAVEGCGAQPDVVAMMPYGRPNGGRSCLAALASMAQTTVAAVVDELEAGEAAGVIAWDDDAQKVTVTEANRF